ncbi:MAG: hypothetical protein AWU57_470 [Marinobacter sp. T13-3]|nr:MAG: hypothetical protein AWU57_470 [Marinobacter sp. T13-3]
MTKQPYIVTVAMNPSHSARVIVDATSADEANTLAMEGVRSGDIQPAYELDEDSLSSAEIYLPDPDSTELANQPGPKCYVCGITVVDGNHEYPHQFVVWCPADDNINQIMTETLHTLRGEANPRTATPTWADFEDGTAAKNPHYKEISVEDYAVLRQHLPTL